MSSLVHHFFHVKGGVASLPQQKSSPTTATTAAAAISAKKIKNVYIAVQGCCHGDLDKIYAACATHEQETGRLISFLICCGDFQAIRTAADLRSMAVPEKYKTMGDFSAYYNGTKKAPYLTLFVGGNHENSDWLATECYGGYLAPNIYYVGHAGAVIVDHAVTVAGLSGIFCHKDYTLPYPPRPFSNSEAAKRSAYHVRKIEIEKLCIFAQCLERIREADDKQNKEEEEEEEKEEKEKVRKGKEEKEKEGAPGEERRSVETAATAASPFTRVNIFVSHDWPVGITKYGDEAQLLRHKPFFADDIRHKALGNPHTMPLLRLLRPQFWFAAHLHCRFDAHVPHHDDRVAGGSHRVTEFLALDKCVKGRNFLHFMNIPVPCTEEDNTIEKKKKEEEEEEEEEKLAKYDGEDRIVHHPLWLEVLRQAHSATSTNNLNWTATSSALAHESVEKLKQYQKTTTTCRRTRELLDALQLRPIPLMGTSPPPPPHVTSGGLRENYTKKDVNREADKKTQQDVSNAWEEAITWTEDTTPIP